MTKLNPLLNESRGNMYDWVDYTYNPLAGKCIHSCEYCYMKDIEAPAVKEKYSGKPRLVENAFEGRMPEDKTVFVCSATDLFAENISDEIIEKVLDYISEFEDTTFLLQTKNANRLRSFSYPNNALLGVTIETDKDYDLSNAPKPTARLIDSVTVNCVVSNDFMVNIEPILEFELEPFVILIEEINPTFVSVGADSGNHDLSEPSYGEAKELIKELGEITEVRTKNNLKNLKET